MYICSKAPSMRLRNFHRQSDGIEQRGAYRSAGKATTTEQAERTTRALRARMMHWLVILANRYITSTGSRVGCIGCSAFDSS